ncbi:MAG: DUF5723 family protein [Bacteroidales bacterium]|nr:DUF5723 family protein [Bacteroidales bacterium]
MKKINNKMRLLLLTALFAVLAMPQLSNAQSNLMYGSSRNPLMNSANPAFFPSRAKVYISLPNANFNFTSPLSYNSIFQYDSTQQKTIINANSIIDTLTDGSALRFGTGIYPAGLGIDFGKFFLTLSAQAKVDMGMSMPTGLLTFLTEGNYGHTGDDVIELLNGDLIGARVYAEGALGFGIRLLDDDLTIGARAKLLMGYMDLSNAASSLTIRTAEDYSSMTANLNLDMNMTSCLDIIRDTVNGTTSVKVRTVMPKNYGINFDLGVRYTIGRFDLSASILDIGPGIHWTDGVKKVVSANENNSFTFTGLDVSQAMQGGTMDSTFTRMLIDSLKTLAEYKVIDGGEGYWTSIPTKVNLGGMFNVTNWFSAGVLFHGEFDRGVVKVGDVFKTKTTGFYSRTTLMARAGFKDWIEVVAAASIVSSKSDWSFFNPGVGVTLTPFRTLQFYAFLDYISNIYLVDAKQFNISFGLNLFFGKGNSK